MSSQITPQKKILCITNDFGPRAGGIETFVIGLIERMPKDSIIVFTSSQDGSAPFDAKWMSEYGVEVIRDRSRILLPTFRIGIRVRALVREREIRTVFFGAAAPLALLSQGLRKACVTRIVALTHGHEVWWSKVWPFSWAMRRIGNGVDHLTYLGEYTRRSISQALTQGAREAMVKIAPGIDTEHFAPRSDAAALRRELGLADKKVIVSVGRLVHRKGQDRLIESLPEILTQIPQAHILFIGDGPYKAELERKYPDVCFAGAKTGSELAEYFASADCFVFTSRSDTFGVVIIESLAVGTPVAAYPVPGPVDILENGITGHMSEDLKASIDVCLGLPRDRVEQVSTKWTWLQCWEIFKKNLVKASI